MLIGRFGNTSARPYIEGRVALPRLGCHADISFLVDSGADVTYLMPTESALMGIDYNQLVGGVQTSGIGGECTDFQERALIAFSEPGKRVYVYDIDILITNPQPYNQNYPSLLGRDILSRWRTVIDWQRNKLTFTVQSADHIVKL